MKSEGHREAGATSLGCRALGAAVAVAWATPGTAWIFPEHRDITAAAVAGLDGAQRRALEEMWTEARGAGAEQLCHSVVDPAAEPPEGGRGCIDFAALPALAGDHACSSSELWDVATAGAWTLQVVAAAARVKERLARAKEESERDDAWNSSHLAMQAADHRYLTRAAGNNAHFLLPRATVEAGETLEAYVDRCLDPVQPINGAGLYVDYHVLALRLAALSRGGTPGERPGLARRALRAEAFALHFLEDSYAAGHYAGTWGDSAWRKGTHDLYSQRGLTTMTWGGALFGSHGDAHMSEHDLRVAAEGVRRSLADLARAVSAPPLAAVGPLSAQESAMEGLDVCGAGHLPPAAPDPHERAAALEVLRASPIPAGDPDAISPPRERAEVGPFIGVAAGIRDGLATGGYEATGGLREAESLEAGVRLGYGLEGLLTSTMDGQFWIQASLVASPAQLDLSCPGCPGGKRTDSSLPRVPARFPLRFVLRMPYYVVPGDLMLLAPVLVFAAPDALQSVVFAAAYGGLLRLQRRISTGIGTFQFILGREVGLTLSRRGDRFYSSVAPPDPGSRYALVSYASVELDLPLIEYVPPKVFHTTLSLAASVQLGFSVEFPIRAALAQQGDARYGGLGPSYLGYLRVVLDARRCF